MSDNNEYDSNFKRDSLIAEVLLRITALENLLIQKNIITNEEITQQLKTLSNKISKIISNPEKSISTNDSDDNDAIADNTEKSEYEVMFEQFGLTTKKISKGN